MMIHPREKLKRIFEIPMPTGSLWYILWIFCSILCSFHMFYVYHTLTYLLLVNFKEDDL